MWRGRQGILLLRGERDAHAGEFGGVENDDIAAGRCWI